MTRVGLKYGLAAMAAVLLSAFAVHAQTAKNLKCKGCVDSTDLAADAVTSAKIDDGQVRPADLSGTAKPAGGAFSELNDWVDLGDPPTRIRGVTINAPSSGIVFVTASGNPYFTSTDYSTINCNITRDKNSQIVSASEIVTAQTGSFNVNLDTPIALTRGFRVKKGKVKIYFLCRQISGNNTAAVYDPVLTAIFVPGKYGSTISEAAGRAVALKPDR